MTSAVDGSLRIRGRNILGLNMLFNGLTIRESLAELLKDAWNDEEYPDSYYEELARAGVIRSETDDDGNFTFMDRVEGDRLIQEAIDVLSAEPFRPIGTKTDTERRLAQLQRRNSRGKSRK